MAKKKVFVSFDYEKDKCYKFLLKAWDANPDFEFSFSDKSSEEINTDDISRVKAGLTTKINQATYTLVIVGEDANKRHHDYEKIGYRNWQNFEIARSIENGNKLVGVKINSKYPAPEEMLGKGATWALTFTQDAIIQALKDAAKK
jgi:hypothetical protein